MLVLGDHSTALTIHIGQRDTASPSFPAPLTEISLPEAHGLAVSNGFPRSNTDFNLIQRVVHAGAGRSGCCPTTTAIQNEN